MRATVVQGMPSTTVTSAGVSVVDVWISMPSCLCLLRFGTVTSIPRRSVASEAVEVRGGPVGEGRAGTAGEDGGHEVPLEAEQFGGS